MTQSKPRVEAQSLERFVARTLAWHNVPEDDARQAANVLVASDLRGIDSHGVSRLFHYCEQLRTGRVEPRPKIQIVRETASTATVDGGNGLGLVVGPWANRLALQKAAEAGSGWVTVRNSNHFGIAGYYPLRALESDCIGWAMTNASALVAPLWSSQRMLGTNPIAIAFPGRDEPPVVIDMATSAVAFGKITLAKQHDRPLPMGWAVDGAGVPLTDPNRFDNDAALTPLGGSRESGGHKGYALASMVDILCGLLSGACWGPFAPMFYDLESRGDPLHGEGLGHFFGALRIDGFCDPDDFRKRVDHWVRTFRNATPAQGFEGPLIPGDPERLESAMRASEGVPIHPTVFEQLRSLAHRTGLETPASTA